jgi:hypothetical protein
MATLVTNTQLTLIELAKRLDPKGNAAVIAEVLNETNEIMGDIPWSEANNTFSHKTTRRLSLPSGSWRKLNAGVSSEISTTVEVTETLGMLETYAENDKMLIDSYPDKGSGRMQEASAFIEGLGQELIATVIYGSTITTPEEFDGLAVRMGNLDADGNVIGQGGTGSDLTSIYIVQWGLDKTSMMYPKGSKNIGIEHNDLGEVTKIDSNSKMWQVYRDHFKFSGGIVCRNPRNMARLANIETTGTSNIFDEDNLIKLLNRMPQRGKGAKLYCNQTVFTQMEIKLKDKTNVNYTASKGEGLAGEQVMHFRGCPIKLVEQILDTEAAIT